MIQSRRDARNRFESELIGTDPANFREHRYVGGPPPARIRRMQFAHETRARKLGLEYDLVDLRKVYSHHKGLCGICGGPVSLDEFTIDHIVPVSRGGPHLFGNMQLAHRGCNASKGDV